MNTTIDNNIQSKIFDLPDWSRVWIYQINRPLTEVETTVLRQQVQNFTQEWTAHNHQLTAQSDVLYNQFIILANDESQENASGCSIDKSIHFLQDIENQYDITVFERLTFAYLEKNEVKTVTKSDFKQLYTEGVINDETLVFDNLVNSVGALKTTWLKPLKQSWHKRFVK